MILSLPSFEVGELHLQLVHLLVIKVMELSGHCPTAYGGGPGVQKFAVILKLIALPQAQR